MEQSQRKSARKILNFLKYATLVLIPLILLLSSLDTIISRDKAWYGGGYDPEYAYLFNSLNIARFRLVGHIDHPGTTMQVMGGLILEGAWLAENSEGTLTKAVLTDPEHYIRILNISTAIIGSFAILLLAYFLARRTDNIWYALLFQISPFISGFILYNGYTRITQELMLMISAQAMAVVSLIWYFQQDKTNQWRFVILFGIISGFGMASKIIFVPLMFIPFILLTNIKNKVRYLFVSSLSFIVFTLPAIRLYPNMLYWIYRLFIHSGQYGTGTKEVINTKDFADNLINLFIASPVLATIFGISVIVLIILVITGLLKLKFEDKKAYKLLIAVVLAQAIGYLLVAKHPKVSYLLTIETIAVVNIILLINLAGKMVNRSSIRNVLTPVVTICLIIAVVPYGLASKKSIYNTNLNPVKENIWEAATSAPGKYAVICENPGSSPVAGLFFGNSYSRNRYQLDLQNIYPDFYILNTYNEKIINWRNHEVSIDSLTGIYGDRIFYLGKAGNQNSFTELLRSGSGEWYFEEIYNDGYQILKAPVAVRDNELLYHRKLVYDGAEVAPDNPSESIKYKGITFSGIIDNSHAYTGKSCIKANPASSYAFAVEPDFLKAGDSIKASVFACGIPENLRIVISGEDSDDFYYTSGKGNRTEQNLWFRLNLDIVIPLSQEGKKIKLYAWNKGEEEAFFDSFRLEIFRKNQLINSENESVIGE